MATITIGPSPRRDEELQRRVTNYLASRHRPALRQLRVDVSDGTVTLSGRLDSFHEKQIALNSCQRVAGVVRLNDCVDVA